MKGSFISFCAAVMAAYRPDYWCMTMTSLRDYQRRHHDIPPAGMGGTYAQWLRHQEKQERLARREEQQELRLRAARNRMRAAKAAKTRRKRKHARQVSSALHSVLVAGVAVALLISGTVIKQVWRTGI
jgi:hypothetical protein